MKITKKLLVRVDRIDTKSEKGVKLNRKERRFLESASKKILSPELDIQGNKVVTAK